MGWDKGGRKPYIRSTQWYGTSRRGGGGGRGRTMDMKSVPYLMSTWLNCHNSSYLSEEVHTKTEESHT